MALTKDFLSKVDPVIKKSTNQIYPRGVDRIKMGKEFYMRQGHYIHVYGQLQIIEDIMALLNDPKAQDIDLIRGEIHLMAKRNLEIVGSAEAREMAEIPHIMEFEKTLAAVI